MNPGAAKAKSALALVGDAVVATDDHQRIRYVNGVAAQLLGCEPAALLGRPLEDVLPGAIADADGDNGSQTRRQISLNFEGVARDLALETVSMADEEGHSAGTVFILHDESVRQRVSDRLVRKSSQDDLTGLLNRREFEQRLEVLIDDAASSLRTHALLYLDVDQFKLINDTCGHLAGDQLLRLVGQYLTDKVQQGDIIGRLGSDEFGILLCSVTVDEATDVAQRLRRGIEQIRLNWRSASFAASVSIGLTMLDGDTGTPTRALSQVDIACFAAKDAGRNHVHVYLEDDIELAARKGEMHWPARIKWALEEKRLCLAAQLIMPLQDSNAPVLAEMLMRIRSPDGSLIAPGTFIPAAERYSLMPLLDRWTISQVLELLSRNDSLEVAADRYTINLSGSSIGDPEFLRFIIDAFRRTGVDPRRICFEVTETAAVASYASAVRFMSLLREIGCTFALDDFGSGMSSFAYLKKLPLDYLKIDGQFVRDLAIDPFHRAIVKSITEVDKAAGLITIAEFVEDEATRNRLIKLGVDYGQGFHIHEPVLLNNADPPPPISDGWQESA